MKTTTWVLRFSGLSSASVAATVHADACPVVAVAKRGVTLSRCNAAELATEVADLRDRGYKVRTCKCAR